jgi:hypothetical protein
LARRARSAAHIGFGSGPKTKLDMEIIGVVEDALYEGAAGRRPPTGFCAVFAVGLSGRGCVLCDDPLVRPDQHVRRAAP